VVNIRILILRRNIEAGAGIPRVEGMIVIVMQIHVTQGRTTAEGIGIGGEIVDPGQMSMLIDIGIMMIDAGIKRIHIEQIGNTDIEGKTHLIVVKIKKLRQ